MKKFTAALSATLVVAFLALLSIPVFYLNAQEPDAAPRTLQQEMGEINLSLKEIAALLKKHVEGQNVDLLIKRIELNNRTLNSKRGLLSTAQGKTVDLREESNMLTRQLEALERSMENAEEVDPYMGREEDMIEQRLKDVSERRQDLEREIVLLENDVMSEEEDMRILKSVLDERLGLE